MRTQEFAHRRGDATRATRGATTRTARVFLLVEAATFVAAAAIHAGALVDGYRHREAAIAEAVIAVVLVAALALSWTPRPWPARLAFAAQGFAFAGTLVGLFTIAVGVGPRTVPDVAYHVAILVVIGGGLRAVFPGAAVAGQRDRRPRDPRSA